MTATKEINQDLFKRFTEYCKKENIASCFSCPDALAYTVSEKLPESVHNAYRNLPNFKDGKLFTHRMKPDISNASCLACFKGWFNHNKELGNICINCEKWIGRKRGIEIIATHEWEDTKKQFKTSTALCEVCSTEALKNLPKKDVVPAITDTQRSQVDIKMTKYNSSRHGVKSS